MNTTSRLSTKYYAWKHSTLQTSKDINIIEFTETLLTRFQTIDCPVYKNLESAVEVYFV